MTRKASLKKEIAAVEDAGKKAAKGAGKVTGESLKVGRHSDRKDSLVKN